MDKLLICGGTVVDGSGSPGIKADIALEAGLITEIAPTIKPLGHKVLDATDLVVSPGFIDIHSHTDGFIFANPFAESMLFQGVTTEVTGNCGIGTFPVNPHRADELADHLTMHGFSLPEEGISWSDFSEYASTVEKTAIGLNLAPLIGHGALRIAAMGSKNQPPSETEMAQMKNLLDRDLKQGAWGLSTGLIYPPGSYAQTEELIELGKVLAKHDALFTSHVRGESETLLTAIDEVIEISEKSGVRVEVSHLKAIGEPNWGKGKLALDRILEAHSKGIPIGADQYPYEASNTVLSVLVPAWVHDGGVKALLGRLADPTLKDQLESEIADKIAERGGAPRIMIASVGSNRNRQFVGKRLNEVAAACNLSPAQTVVRLLLEEQAIVDGIYFSISETDLEYILANLTVAVGSDGAGIEAKKSAAESVHPRYYGTFSRVLGHFVRDRKLLTLEQAIYKMTGLPAKRLQLARRGLLRKGFAADLVVFDPNVINDTATFADPHHYAIGNRFVIVNGELVAEDGKLTGKAPGQVLRKLK